jgi:hypothetical protein
MNVRPFEVWKAMPPGFERAHWFVIVSPAELCAAPSELQVNGLACFSLRGQPAAIDVRLNGADGFAGPTVCACDFFYPLDKAKLHDGLGPVSWERQQQIKATIKAVFRL